MTEVEKLYENVNIKPTHYDACKIADAYWLNEELANEYGTFDNYMKLNCKYHYQECTDECKHAYDRDTYPPFTAEKQLAILQLLTQQCDLTISHLTEWEFIHFDGQEPLQITGKDFTETFAKLISAYWQFLTEEERKQIKEILSE